MATIRKRGPYQWEVRIRKKGYPVQCKTFETKVNAEAWASTIESEMARGVFRSYYEADRLTLAELLEKYAQEITPQKKGAVQEISKLKVISRHSLAKYIISNIGGKELAEYRDARLKKVSPKTVRDDLVLLGHLFKVAMQDWGIELPHGNPIDTVRKPKVGNNSRNRRLSAVEQTELIEACRCYGGELLSIVLLAIETGMRRSELVGLRWEYINYPVINLPDTKNGEARSVPLSKSAVKLLKSLPRNIEGHVFTMKASSVTKAFKRVCERAGFEDMRFHDLRHEATSRFFEKGLNPMQVSSITGHKTLQMLKRYTHLRAEDLATMLG